MLDVTPTKAVLWEYGFDWLDRLVTVKRAGAVDVVSLPASPLGPTALQRSYVFDESDYRTFFANEVLPQVDHVNDVTYYYKYKSIDDNGTTRYSDQLEEILIYENTAGHRIVGDFDSFESLEHDLDGNLTQRTITSTGEEISYQWTALDRLKRVESSANGRMQDARYDVNGLRKRKLDKNGNGSREYGVGISTTSSEPLTGPSAAPSISYISGHMIMGAEIDGEFVYHLGDALSTVRDVVDHTGSVIKSFEFDEYGNLLSSTGSAATSSKTWIGGLSVNDDRADSGMFNMGHRNYAAGVLGRFISRDPIGHAGGLNLRAYPTNPVTFSDPTGLDVHVYCEGKERQVAETDQELIRILNSAAPNSITKISALGHANPNSQSFDPSLWNRNDPNGLAMVRGEVYITGPNGRKRLLSNHLKGKLKKGAGIELRGCDTGGGRRRE